MSILPVERIRHSRHGSSSDNSTEGREAIQKEKRKFPDYSHQEDRPGGPIHRSASAEKRNLHMHSQNRSASSRVSNWLLHCAVIEVACRRCIVESTEDIELNTRTGQPRGPASPTV